MRQFQSRRMGDRRRRASSFVCGDNLFGAESRGCESRLTLVAIFFLCAAMPSRALVRSSSAAACGSSATRQSHDALGIAAAAILEVLAIP